MNFTELTHHHIVRLQGAGAAKFLDNLTCNKINNLSKPVFASLLDVKGTIVAQFFAYGDAHQIYLQTPTPQKLGQSLAKNKLGLPLKISQVTQNIFTCWGRALEDSERQKIATQSEIVFYQDPRKDSQKTFEIYYMIGAQDKCRALLASLPSWQEKSMIDWQDYRMQYGLLDDEYRHQNLLLAHLHIDSLNGIDWHKGCYPGQEICARIHFKGDVKRKIFPFAAPNRGQAKFETGEAIFNAQGKNIGTILATGKDYGLIFMAQDSVGAPLYRKDKMMLKSYKPEWLGK